MSRFVFILLLFFNLQIMIKIEYRKYVKMFFNIFTKINCVIR